LAVTAREAGYTTTGVEDLLSPSVEGMTLGTDFGIDTAGCFGGASGELVSASATDARDDIVRVNP
jgi:hypothetical protein